MLLTKKLNLEQVTKSTPRPFHRHEISTQRERRWHDDRIINVIFGEYSAGGSSNNSRKSYFMKVFNINAEASKRP